MHRDLKPENRSRIRSVSHSKDHRTKSSEPALVKPVESIPSKPLESVLAAPAEPILVKSAEAVLERNNSLTGQILVGDKVRHTRFLNTNGPTGTYVLEIAEGKALCQYIDNLGKTRQVWFTVKDLIQAR